MSVHAVLSAMEARPHHFLDVRRFGGVDMFEWRQPGGHYVKPAVDGCVFQLVLDGGRHVEVDTGAQIFRGCAMPGQLLLPAARAPSSYVLDGDTQGVAIVLPIDLIAEVAEEARLTFDNDFGALHESLWRDQELAQATRLLWRASRGDSHAPDIDAELVLRELVLRLLRTATGTSAADGDVCAPLAATALQRVCRFIDDTLETQITLLDLAQVAGLSPFHFARAFKSASGQTPHSLVMNRRLARAKTLLRTKAPLAEIAQACGFASQQHMTTAFARHEGVTPGRLRRDWRS